MDTMTKGEAIRRVAMMRDAQVWAALSAPDAMLRAAASWRHYPQYDWPHLVAAECAGDFHEEI